LPRVQSARGGFIALGAVRSARAMAGMPEKIVLRWIAHCTKTDPEYGNGIAKQLGIDPGKATWAD
jgi:catalase